ncbi:MAG TPA: CBS domain-containing protein [Candidatus Marinimicrobia bacterium]|nr:CBS domain-containing protein [Candidatus Neomarinimicrobiota bacterium]HIB52905.1 CBS domain-containing protein [Candidatus Neomarinimicrobiota bacterium]
MMTTIAQLLNTKGNQIWSVEPKATIFEALEIMSEKEIGALLVMEDGKLTGIFSERDYARKVILKGKSSKETPVGELMTKKVFYIDPQKTINDCMAMMTAKRIRHVPVIEDNQVMGIVTIGDVVNQIISEQEVTINHLENYITGSH